MKINLLTALLLVCLQNAVSSYEVTIYPEEEEEDWGHKDKPLSRLDLRLTTFFNIAMNTETDEDGDEIKNEDDDTVDQEVDIFPWKSTQRVVFTMTNPIGTHKISVHNMTATLKDEEGDLVEILPPFRLSEIALHQHETHSVAYEFKV